MSSSRKVEWLLTGTIGFALLIVLPVLNCLPSSSALYLSDFYLNLIGKYLSLSILALGMDLIWGYTGILSLGQGLFFGLGGYSMGMYLMLAIGHKGAYGEAIPDFMVWNQVKMLPLFWKPFHSFIFASASAVFLPAAVAALFGFLTFRRQVKGVYFAIITQALVFVAWLLFCRNEMKLGGTNGLTDYKTILGFSLSNPKTMRSLYILTAFFLIAAYFLCRWLTRSLTGRVLTAIRDKEQRLHFLGYNVSNFKIFIFSLSAAMAGLAGALYVPQVGIITPAQIGVVPSLEMVVWVAAGGRGTLVGSVLGAVGINAARSYLTARFPQFWPHILGAIFVSVVLFFPDGAVGLPGQIWRLLKKSEGGTSAE